MEKTVYPSGILGKPTNWQNHYLKCEEIKSELVLYTKDLRFLQQLLDRYFNEMVKNEPLDEIRESLMRFQDICYNCDRLMKRVKDQQSNLINLMKSTSDQGHDTLLKEQMNIENRSTLLNKNFKIVKKEMFTIADHVLETKKVNENPTYST
ncbi:MAG: hypothetical protein HKP49_05445 [Maribacter sp.]|nr:hypothetical protein [Maribacter sp.]